MLVHDASKSTMKLSKKWPQEDDNTGEASEAQAQREVPVQSARRGRRTAADPTDTPVDASSATGADVPFQPARRATSNKLTSNKFTSNKFTSNSGKRRVRIPAELLSPVPTHAGADATGHGPDTARPRRDDTHAAAAAAAAAGVLRGAD